MSDIYPLWNFHRTIADFILRTPWLNEDGERVISHFTILIFNWCYPSSGMFFLSIVERCWYLPWVSPFAVAFSQKCRWLQSQYKLAEKRSRKTLVLISVLLLLNYTLYLSKHTTTCPEDSLFFITSLYITSFSACVEKKRNLFYLYYPPHQSQDRFFQMFSL